MDRVLKKYTTIPNELYVQRDADIQLERIIKEMQRPGYVLVARQMGKTNLLLNAKRKLENDHRIFAYIDLSNLFEEERDCYRNIIDYIIEPNHEIFSPIEFKIDEIRNQYYPPHKEYSRSLKIILDCFKGDLVVVLDEIDALKSVKYSDNIFAQIRSTYFQLRTSSVAFDRLTYVLSGVIEPSDLINDRNKSPFNIGDKIYLDDFSKSEHDSFIQKSKIKISEKISEEIYNWTKGNPRLTFDICFEVESKILFDKQTIQLSDVEKIINEKYLTLFDIPPIDHIRQLVSHSRPIRKAIKEIQRGKQNCSDAVKTKLYLYGIISSNFSNPIKIKNRIISECLSLEWIEAVNKQTQDTFTYGLEKFDDKNYQEAIAVLSEFLANSTPNKKQIEICHYHIGRSYFNLKDYEDARECFLLVPEDGGFFKDAQYFLGRCYLSVGKEEKGIEILEELIDDNSSRYSYRNSLLVLATYYMENKVSNSIELFDKLILSCDEDEEDSNNVLTFKTLAHYYKAVIYVNQEELEKGLYEVTKAKETAQEDELLEVLYTEYLLKIENVSPIQEITNIIVSKKLEINDNDLKNLNFNEKNLIKYLGIAFLHDENSYSKLVDYAKEVIYKGIKDEVEILFDISLTFQKASDRKKALNEILKKENEIENDSFLMKVYKEICLYGVITKKEYIINFDKYANIFLASKQEIDVDDITLFSHKARIENSVKHYEKGISTLNIIEVYLPELEGNIYTEGTLIYFWLAILHFNLKNNIEAISYAQTTLDIIANKKLERLSIVDEKGLDTVSSQMKQIIASAKSRVPIKSLKKYGRNDKIEVKYKDGKLEKGKYKKFEADIISHECFIVRALPKVRERR